MGMKEEMKKFEEQERFIKATFGKEGFSLQMHNVTVLDNVSLIMALLDSAVEKDEELLQKVLAEFILKQTLKGGKDD